MNKIEIGIRLLIRLTWLCFLVFVEMKTRECMTGFDLPQNFHSDPESLLRRVRPRIVPPQISLSTAEPFIQAPSVSQVMAQKTLRDYSAPSANQVPTWPEVNTREENFEIKTGLITMVQASSFCGKVNEVASAHLQ